MMISTRFTKCLIASLLIPWMIPAAGSMGAAEDPAALLPDDCLLYVAVNNISASREALKNTSAWGLYKDPAMQGFIGPAEKAIREKLDEVLQKAWKELEMEQAPESLPFPTGRAIFAMRLGTTKIMMPVYDWSDPQGGAPKIKETKEIRVPDLQVLGIAEMGENMPALKEIIERTVEKSLEKGQQHVRETVRGIEIHILNPGEPERPPGAPPGAPAPPTQGKPFCYAIADNTILVSSNPDLLKDAAARLSGAETKSLADNPARGKILRRLGAPGDVTFFLNVPAALEFIRTISPESPNPQIETTLQALGLTNVTGLGVVVKIAPNEKRDLSVKGLIAVEGEKRGILDLLSPKSTATTGNPLLTKGLASFLVANYEFNTFYEKIRQMVVECGRPDIDQQIQGMMMATGMPDPETNPPVNLQKEVLDQLTGPLVLKTQITKPYTDPNSSRTMISLGVQDARVLTGALGRIHAVFIAQGNEEMTRELLNTDIFLFQSPTGIFRMMVTGGMGAAGASEPWALAVPGGNLVIGSVSGVEQEIRDLRRKDLEPIEADPMYRHAAAALPARAGAWFYSNQQISSEAMWERLKELARTPPPPEPQGSEGEPTDFRRSSPVANGQYGGRISVSPGRTPMGVFIQKLKKYCDFNALPDFETVKKYFGPSIGYVKSTDEGIYFELISLKAPQERPQTPE